MTTFKEKLAQSVPKKIKPNEELNQTTLFTMEGCSHCATALEQYQTEIKTGALAVLKCNPNGTPEEKANCKLAQKQFAFDGFPSIYTKDGKKLL